MQKAVLLVFGLITLLFGIWSLVQPAAIAEAVSIGLPEAASVTEFRAFYGGLETGIAAFWILAAFRPPMRQSALWSMLLVWGGVALTRAAGMAIDDSASATMYFALGLESLAVIVSWIALSRAESPRAG